MSSNEFLPFATGVSPTVLTQSVYSALTARGTGFQSGVADPATVNKVWRQASVIAAMIGQFTADYGTGNVVDDGNIPNLEAQFKAALKTYLEGQNIFVPVVPATTWYVDTALGTDSASHGLSSGSGAFRTGQYAVNYISGFFSPSPVTLNFAAGTYAGFSINSTDGGVTYSQSLISQWNIVGAGAGSTFITQTTTTNNLGRGFQANSHANVVISGFTLEAIYEAMVSNGQSVITCYNCNFVGFATSSAAVAAYYGSLLQLQNNSAIGTTSASFAISGTFASIIIAASGGQVLAGYQDATRTYSVTITFGTTTVAGAVANGSTSGSVYFFYGNVTWAGSTPTGQRFTTSQSGGVSALGSASYTWIPGTVAGVPNTATVTSTGGYYQP